MAASDHLNADQFITQPEIPAYEKAWWQGRNTFNDHTYGNLGATLPADAMWGATQG